MSDQITDSAPSDVTMEVAALAADLDTVVAGKTNENLGPRVVPKRGMSSSDLETISPARTNPIEPYHAADRGT